MEANMHSPPDHHDNNVKPSSQQIIHNDADSSFNMKECSEALVGNAMLEKDGTGGSSCEIKDEEEDVEEFTDANDFVEHVDYDEEHLKELFEKMTDDELEEQRKISTSLKNDGNEAYRKNNFAEARNIYTCAINACPLQFTSERSVLYANRAASLVSLERKEEAITDCNKALELNPDYLKVLIRRAQLHRKSENLDQSLEDYKKVLEMDRDNREAKQACATLPGEINERNEKLKTEMLGKLKDLGNMVLKPFGLSTENFNMVQDPNSGGYSINFQNNPKSS